MLKPCLKLNPLIFPFYTLMVSFCTLTSSAVELLYRPLQMGELLLRAVVPPREFARLLMLALVLLLFPILLTITDALIQIYQLK